MKHAFSEHWKGVAAGAFLLMIGLYSFMLMFYASSRFWREDYVGSADEVFAHFASNAAPPVDRLEYHGTAVIESPYGAPGEDADWSDRLLVLLIVVVAGAAAARIGGR